MTDQLALNCLKHKRILYKAKYQDFDLDTGFADELYDVSGIK